MKKDRRSTMLECWRPPTGVGEPIGCMATTFTFDSNFFEEECLSRFLNIDSHPDRDSLAYLLERENMLGATYAGVLIDHLQAGVDHSLRWDVLPVRLPGGDCQHAKISVLAWAGCIRILVSSANLTPTGYRNNQEVAGILDFTPESMDHDQLAACCIFLSQLLEYVPTAGDTDTVHQRAKGFLDYIQQYTATWKSAVSRKNRIQTFFIFNLPKSKEILKDGNALPNINGTLNGCLDTCIRFGGAPSSVKVASPFFNQYDKGKASDEVTATLGKRMARGTQRTLTFCIPSLNNNETERPRLAAPRALQYTALRYVQRLFIETLPHADQDNNFRPWHSKMLWLENSRYVALMIGSSNFTSPGMGLRNSNNAEANLLYLTPQKAYAKEKGQLAQCWPHTIRIEDLNTIEWTGSHYELGETDIDQSPALPSGFLAARFQAGDTPQIMLYFLSEKLPHQWQVYAGRDFTDQVVDSDEYDRQDRPAALRIPWKGETPGKLLVQWQDKQTFWPVNVENEHELPLASEIDSISVHDLIYILAAHDYSMAIRAWARRQNGHLEDENNLEDAVPVELDPLRRFRLQDTFLHRIRTRARMLAGVRHNLQRPAWTEKALQWRLEGIIGIKSLADKLMAFKENGNKKTIEAVFELIDFFIMLDEVKYQPALGAIDQTQFDAVYRPFVCNLLESANAKTKQIQNQLPPDIRMFWERIYQRCRQ